MAISDEDRQGYLRQLAELRDLVVELSAAIHQIDGILAPALAAEARAKDEIRRTMPFKLGDGARRKPAYDTLLAIAVEWGKTRNERRDLAKRHDAYARKIESLNKLLAKEAKRGKKSAA